MLAPEAPGSEPPTNLGSTGHAHHAIGRCAHDECGVSNVRDDWSRLVVHLAEGHQGAASSRAGVRTWLLRRARKARGVPALAPKVVGAEAFLRAFRKGATWAYTSTNGLPRPSLSS